MAIKGRSSSGKAGCRSHRKTSHGTGEATDALIEGMNESGSILTVTGPMHTPVKAHYGYLKDSSTAVMEMASAAGITLVPDDAKDPLLATSYGVGEMINHALQKGCRNFIIGIGGSATNDGGIGMLKALGVRFVDENDVDAGEGGQALAKVSRIDISGLNPLLERSSYSGGMRCE
ncbi:MAG: glycerate kinase [Ruminococcus sp.]